MSTGMVYLSLTSLPSRGVFEVDVDVQAARARQCRVEALDMVSGGKQQSRMVIVGTGHSKRVIKK